ncbi:MAG TPA: cytochrome c biogenesis protein CcdA [Ktedonobacteraceae bacterium]|nr:cytochrome c biogenesis protein CcdA [Ktedonobacteraceae bacterium]
MLLIHFGLLAAFGAGLLSFFSPCVFPLVPGYLSYLAGTSLQEAQSQPTTRWRVSLHALCFVLGFALLFTLLGAAAALLGSALHTYQQVLARVAGLLLILFGIALTGLVPIPWVSRDHRVQVKQGASAWWRSGLIGMAFGAGWSACTGPILGSILVLTAASATLLQGVIFLLAYALGLGLPFVLVGILADRAGTLMRRIRRYTGPLSFIGGAILILMGMLILTGRLDQLANVLFPFSFSR